MKRIILILAVLCLVVVLAVPALAVSGYDGEWYLTKISFSGLTGAGAKPINASFTSNGESFVGMYVFNNYKDISYKYNDTDSLLVCDDGKWIVDEAYKTVVISGDFSTTSEAYSWWANVWSKRTDCDSSVCPSVDSDGDGYCDNCGGFFTPPPPDPLVEAVTALKERNQLIQVLTQVVTMIPIGLVCWVSYKAFRKGLAILQTILHQA